MLKEPRGPHGHSQLAINRYVAEQDQHKAFLVGGAGPKRVSDRGPKVHDDLWVELDAAARVGIWLPVSLEPEADRPKGSQQRG